MKTKLILILTVLLAGCNLAIAQSPYATRLPAELQTAQMDSLADVTWLQGTTPAIRVEPLLRGRPVAVDADTTVRMVIGPSATGTLYAARTNLAAVTNAYEIQWPTVGTNSAGEAWFYTLLFDRAGYTYWSGSGKLYIEETTSTASNGLAWIEYTTPNVGWGNIVGDPGDNAALVQYVEAHGGGSAEDTVARAGVASNAADIAIMQTGKLDVATAATTYQPVGDYATGTPLYVETYLGTITGATITGGTVTTNSGVLEFTVEGGSGWTTLAFSGTGNAITGATAAGTTLTLERGTIEGWGAAVSNAAVLRSIATVPASDAYSAPASESLPFVVTNTGALTLSGLTDGSIGIRMTTTNASGVALYAAVVKDGVGETIATINPACDGSEQSARWPWNASETLTIEATDIASPVEGAEFAIITAAQVETWADVSLVGKTNDLADQHLYVDYPAAPNEAANRAYADDAADAALALALGEIATATFNRDLAGYVQRWNPRFDTVADSNSLSTLYGGSTALRLDGEGAAVVPEIKAFSVEAGEVATLTVWSYSGGATNLVPEVTTNLTTGTWEKKPESIVSATNIDAFTAQIVFTNDFERLLYVRLVDVSGGSGVPVLRVFGGIAFGDGEAITDWPTSGSGTGATQLIANIQGQAARTSTYDAGTATLTLADLPAPEGGGGGTADPFSSILVEADWTWTNSIYAVGADTSSTNIAVTLPDAGTNFASVVIRKFSNLNQLSIVRGTNVVYTLYDDGSTRSYDWWPQRTNWYWRN